MMIGYPLTRSEYKVVNWAGGVITLVAIATIALLGTAALASS